MLALGSSSWYLCGKGQAFLTSRCATQAVPQVAAHGPGLHYNVSVNVASAQSCSPDGPQCSYSVETNATHAVVSLDDLDFSKGGVLQVTAVNKAGIGRDVAVLHLAPSVGKQPVFFPTVGSPRQMSFI